MPKCRFGSRQQGGAEAVAPRRALAVLVLAATALVGCATTIVAPCGLPPLQIVYVLDHGRSSSLALPDEAGRFVRYVYGDWRWYALNETTVSVGLAALLWPTQGALGRAALPSRFGAGGAPVVYEHLHVLEVEAQRLRALRQRLDALFSTNAHNRVYNALYDLDFVPYPQPYSALHNSNHVIAAWLEELGCEVRGPLLWSRWRLEQRPEQTHDSKPQSGRKGPALTAKDKPGPPRTDVRRRATKRKAQRVARLRRCADG